MPKKILTFQEIIREGQAIFIDKTLDDYWLARLAKPTDPKDSVFIAGESYAYGEEILNLRKMENNNIPPAPPAPEAPELNNAEQSEKRPTVQIVQDDADLVGKFSNLMSVGFSPERDYFKVDFIFVDTPKGKLISRLIVTPHMMHRMIEALTTTYQNYLEASKTNQQ